VKGLKTEAARVEAAASTDQDERYRRAIGRRYLRHRRLSDVEGMIEMRGPIDRTARVMAALVPIEWDLFEEARSAEVCEISGIAPIPVSVAQELSAAAFLKALITDGTDVHAVSHPGRAQPARLVTALEELQSECVIAGCQVDRHLEIDH
jgi:hypothetical protein